MITVAALHAFSDNYIWLLVRGRDAAVVDPGDAAPVRRALESRNLRLQNILVTHHHPDHVGGVAELRQETGAEVCGPAAESIPAIDHALRDGDRIHLRSLDLVLDVLAVPGHTLGHIAFHAPAEHLLFCGDTLFSAGCGRLFEGTPAQMLDSLQRLADLPEQTQVFCAHEYTLANLQFAAAVEPDNPDVAQALAEVRALRASDAISLPSTIGRERRINPFLRTAEAGIIHGVKQHVDTTLEDELTVFTQLRRWKDGFRASS